MTKGFKSFAAIICVVMLLASTLAFSAGASESGAIEEPVVISYTDIPLYVDGECIGSGFMLNSVTYVPLVAFCEEMLGTTCEVSWVQESSSVSLEADGLHIALTLGDNYMQANGRYLYLPTGAYNINGTILVPIRELCKVFNVRSIWDHSEWIVELDKSDLSIISSGEEFYNEDDVYWLSRVIFSESGNQAMDGMIAVGNVVCNRRDSESFPDTIYGVIFQYNQFDVVKSGFIYFYPSDEAVIAAKLCLEGYNTAGDSLFFFNPNMCSGSWITAHKEYRVTIGDHVFYA